MDSKGRLKLKAWLVTWEWAGEYAKRDDRVVAVFNPHIGDVRVRELVEFLLHDQLLFNTRAS